MKIFIKNRQRLIRVNLRKIESDAKRVLKYIGLRETELSILLVNDLRMKALNSLYRGLDMTTDVLSFPQIQNTIHDTRYTIHDKKNASCIMNHASGLVLGDIVINLRAAKRQADRYGFSLVEELRRLLVHGILHLVGYDHEKSKYSEKKMTEKEEELLKYIRKS
ncbi:MAG: rRNA maturation RNase YbeY [Nitrospirae bacterium]|nr:rRNA maturation RNase YbeY [Nitrospirota bacterium]